MAGKKTVARGAIAFALMAIAPVAIAGPVMTVDLGTASESREAALRCLALAIAYEAGNQPVAGQEAVAEVVLNRVRHPGYPHSVCGVVYQGGNRRTGCQFTFVCDGSLARPLSQRMLERARVVAERALAGDNPGHVAGALNYHARTVQPGWARRLDLVAQIGAHLFYRPGAGAAGRVRPLSVAIHHPERAQRGAILEGERPVGHAFRPWGIALR